MTWTDCAIEAIRFGWIDGQKRPLDEVSFLQRLTPRKPGSNWSAKNREHATRLIDEGRMTPAGLAHVEAPQADGRWASAYDGQAAMVIPGDFLDALETRPVAKAFSERWTAKTSTQFTTGSRPRNGPRHGQSAWPKCWTSSIAKSAFTEAS